MRFIDTHSHLNFQKFDMDADQVIRNSLDEDTGMVIVGTNYKTSKRGLDLANKYEKGVYAAVGIHPVHLEDIIEEEDGQEKIRVPAEEFSYEVFEKLAKLEKTVAIGEIGLDYYHLKLDNIEEAKKKQKKALREQLVLSRDLDLPAIIHCRQAHDDLLAALKDFKKEYKETIAKDRPWGVMHCFSGDENLAWQYFDLGLIISFTGIITFSKQWDDLIRKMPIEKLMIETDCPFMAPEPYRGKRNEPVFVEFVARRIAEIREVDVKKIAQTTTQTAKRFFNI